MINILFFMYMDSYNAWEEQIRELNKDDEMHNYILANKIYPSGLFNLTSCPIYNSYSRSKKIKAIITILQHYNKIILNTVHVDMNNSIVHFKSTNHLYHV